jgi:hypothetical protein
LPLQLYPPSLHVVAEVEAEDLRAADRRERISGVTETARINS